jgi:hypothetical protein
MEKKEKIDLLQKKLIKIQKRKSVGKLSKFDVRKFVEIIDKISICQTDDLNIKSILLAKTSWNVYSTTNQKYLGPISCITYENNEFEVFRIEEHFDSNISSRYKEQGIHITLTCLQECKIGEILENIKNRVNLNNFMINKISNENIEFYLYISI